MKSQKAKIPKKHINKYESVPASAVIMSYLAGVGPKDRPSAAVPGDSKVGAVSEPVYEIKEPTRSIFAAASKKQSATVAMNRKTAQVGTY